MYDKEGRLGMTRRCHPDPGAAPGEGSRLCKGLGFLAFGSE